MIKNQIFKKINTIVKTNVIEAPHPTLVAFGISAAITIAVAVVISMLTGDHSNLAYAGRVPTIGKLFPGK